MNTIRLTTDCRNLAGCRYTVRMATMTPTMRELKTLGRRIRARAEAERRDRERQRELVRTARAEGATYADIEVTGQLSRPTLRKALRDDD